MPTNPFTEHHQYQVPTDPNKLRDLLVSQDERLIHAANDLSRVIYDLPHDPAYPNTQPIALIVGGFVRDALIGNHPKDIDVEVYGVAPERLKNLLETMFPGKLNLVGESFGILKVSLGDGFELDVSIPRRESKTGTGHRDFDTQSDPGMSVEDAARRRDFTWNAISANILTGEIHDPFHGLEDLRAGQLRVTDPERFQDDPLRIYRAAQFIARLHLNVEQNSFNLMKEMVDRGELDHLKAERITEEWKKLLLRSERPSVGMEFMRELGVIEREFPELHVMINTPQEPEWHPEGDVWIHTMMVIDSAGKIIRRDAELLSDTEKLQIMLGAVCHDLGKPATTATQDGRIRSLGHAEAGITPTKTFFSKFMFGHDVEHAVEVITLHHLRPSEHHRFLNAGKMDEKVYVNTVRKFVKSIFPVSWRALLAVSEADHRGRTLPNVESEPYEPGLLMERTVREHQLDIEPTKPLILGRDVLARGIKPGKQVGETIRHLENLRDQGKIETREQALTALDEMLT